MILCIPPLIQESKFVTDFHLKNETFNSYFAKRCSPIKNNSRTPLEFLQANEKIYDGKLLVKINYAFAC